MLLKGNVYGGCEGAKCTGTVYILPVADLCVCLQVSVSVCVFVSAGVCECAFKGNGLVDWGRGSTLNCLLSLVDMCVFLYECASARVRVCACVCVCVCVCV